MSDPASYRPKEIPELPGVYRNNISPLIKIVRWPGRRRTRSVLGKCRGNWVRGGLFLGFASGPTASLKHLAGILAVAVLAKF